MSNTLAALALVIGVPWLLRIFGVIERSRLSMQATREAVAILRDSQLDDDTKERQLQRRSLQLLGQSFQLLLSGSLAFALPLGAVWLAAKVGSVSFEAACSTAITWPYLIVAMICGWLLLRPTNKKSNYSNFDRLLHRIAFATRRAQSASADLERKMFARELKQLEPTPPVFLTGLPRSGTTLLLEALAQLPEFASHTYRDMPFVLTPCLWHRMSTPFQRSAEKRERAHGDGVQINYDSPEAFEEVLWMTFHPKHYHKDHIELWDKDLDAEFREFMQEHELKIRWLRRGDAPSRYLSKNNANIARIDALRQLDANATLLVPFRDPIQHAQSLLRQHQHFSKIHAEDPFAARYMAGIGHFEFGSQLRPIRFNQDTQALDPMKLDFWIAYWIKAYRHLLQHRDALHWIDYDQLCEEPKRVLGGLADRLSLSESSRDNLLAHPVRPAEPREVDISEVDADMLAQAREVHAQLRSRD